MTALVFLATLGAIVVAVLAIEAEDGQALKMHRPLGFVTWLTQGNWPAKIGGALIIVGVGALLRYALIHIDIAPPLKLAAGIVIALALGLASMFVPEGRARRPVSLALGGAAFGVAYMTAYSAFALFGYLSNPAGLALLGVTSAAAGVYAVTRSALSLAMLSMVGAFLAPAFAVTDPGPIVVYGYYVGASLLTLAMVVMRGWHPLIHLSFLFTLAGGVFFAWTSQYYTAPHSGVMLPMLLLLSAVHVAMPILEKGGPRAPWAARADLVYMIALPAVAALLAVLIAPNRLDLSTALIGLGVIWGLAALGLGITRRNGVAAHALIAVLLAVLGVAARFKDLPWEVISLALSVGALGVAARLRKSAGRLHSILAGLVVLCGAIHILGSTASPGDGPAFLNATFVERIIGATLLIIAGVTCRRIRQSLDTLLLAAGVIWAFIATGIEVIRWDLATFALVLHWAMLLLAASLWVPGRRLRIADRHAGLVTAAIPVSAVWASAGTLQAAAAWTSLVAASLALIGLAVRPVTTDRDSRGQRFTAALMAPATAAVWAIKAGSISGIEHLQFGLSVATLAAIATLVAGRFAREERGAWLEWACDIFGVAFAAVLAVATLLHIARNPWAVGLELLCLGGLVVVGWIRSSRQRSIDASTAACVAGLALVIQANMLRLLGPPGDLDIGDVLRLQWPAVVSLLWAAVGSALTIWSRKTSSRALWLAGAALLVAAAVKLLLVDFGSLGELANILAVIAAGAVFLLVGWLAPMPPATSQESEAVQARLAGGAGGDGARARNTGTDHKKTAWTVAIVLALAATLVERHDKSQDILRDLFPRSFSDGHFPAAVLGHSRVDRPRDVSHRSPESRWVHRRLRTPSG